VLHERSVRDGHGLPSDQIVRLVEDIGVRIDNQKLVGLRKREGVVEPRPLADRDAESPEALLPSAVKNLKRGMRTDRRDHDVLVVLEERRDGLPSYHYDTNRFNGYSFLTRASAAGTRSAPTVCREPG